MSKNAPRTVSLRELNPTDIIILVVGPTGSGKSSFVSRASGIPDDIVGYDLVSKTSEISAVKYADEESGQDIVLVDTPGLSNTLKDDSEVLRMFTGWSRKLKKRSLVIAGILYFHRISDNRIPSNPLRALCVFGEPCGGLGAALSKTILTLTTWSEVGDAIRDRRLAELESISFWKVILKFMDDEESARDLVREVIRRQRQGPVEPVEGFPDQLGLALKNLEALAERQLAIVRDMDEERRNPPDPNAPAMGKSRLEYEQLRVQMEEAWHQFCNSGSPKPPKRRFFPR
ncbi:hypothetical protein EDC04DRAFT_1477179 [Pisolithus marmoratus]|nr:hypothetical protein EDC04DRAFT_1477179 [Pisolithus marmoratus]